MSNNDLTIDTVSSEEFINTILNSLLDASIISDERFRDANANSLVFSDYRDKLALAIGFDGGLTSNDKEDFINFVKRFGFNLDSTILSKFIRIPCEQIGLQFVFDENGRADLTAPNSLYFAGLFEKWVSLDQNYDPRPDFPEDKSQLNNFQEFVSEYNRTTDDLENAFVGFYCDSDFENYISYKHYYNFKSDTYIPHTMVVDYKSTGVSVNYDIMEDFFESVWWENDHMGIVSAIEASGFDLTTIGIQASAKMNTSEPQNYLHIYG